jgi:hypothetical protein
MLIPLKLFLAGLKYFCSRLFVLIINNLILLYIVVQWRHQKLFLGEGKGVGVQGDRLRGQFLPKKWLFCRVFNFFWGKGDAKPPHCPHPHTYYIIKHQPKLIYTILF